MPESGYWKRVLREGLSRRRMLQGIALGGAGLAAGAAIACSGNQGSAPSTSTSVTKEPKRGGILNRLTALDGVFNQGLDPHKTGGSETGLMNFWYQGLLRSHPVTYEVEGEIAQKWEQPAPTEYVFNLAPNIKWHDKAPVNGRAYTARDAAFSLDRFRTNDALFVNRSLLNGIDEIEAVNDTTLRVTTKVADVTTLLNLADLTCLMLAPEVIQRYERLTTAEHVVGTGAFILREKDDTKATMVRNPNYWKSGLPYLDGANMAWIQEQQSQFSAFLAGQLDIVQVPGEQSKKFLAERGNQYVTGWSPGVNCWFISPNVKQKPYDDARVTRALRLMVDHQEGVKAWAEVYFGNGSSWILPHAMEPWDPRRTTTQRSWSGSNQRMTLPGRRLLSSVRQALRAQIR